MYLVTSDEMREMDRLAIESFGIPGMVLMENAARGAVDVLARHFPKIAHAKVGVAAGRGNNGGDGLAIARYLAGWSVDVVVYLLAERAHVQADAAANLKLAEQMGISVVEIPNDRAFDAHRVSMAHRNLWVDAIFGTGLKSDVRGHFKTIIDFLNGQNRPIFSVDIPSGLNSDTGRPCGCSIKASVTATFGLPKVGQLIYPGASLAGILEVVDIGIPPQVVAQVKPGCRLITPQVMLPALSPRDVEAHKGSAGHLAILAGAPGKTGAAIMASRAAMRAGAGLVTVGIAKSLNVALASQLVEIMTEPLPEEPDGCLGMMALDSVLELLANKRCVAIGPGLGTTQSTERLVQHLIRQSHIPMVIDADGLNCIAKDLSGLKEAKAPLVLTPHPGEMARLMGTTTLAVQCDRIGCARNFAQTHNVCLVLKGAKTVIAHPDATVLVNPTGNAGMASGGMGDVLTGIIAGFLTQGLGLAEAVSAAVYLHGAAADTLADTIGPRGFLASDLIEILPREMARLEASLDLSHNDGFVLVRRV